METWIHVFLNFRYIFILVFYFFTMLSLKLNLKILEETLKTGDFKNICLQFPDGLKPKAKEIIDLLKTKFPQIKFYLWMGSNFGGCDIPVQIKDFDLIVNFGHAEFR